jgi:hypothetical protein
MPIQGLVIILWMGQHGLRLGFTEYTLFTQQEQHPPPTHLYKQSFIDLNMKTKLLILLVLIATVSVAQKQIAKPLIVLDTTYNNTHFIYTWDEGFSIRTDDSTRQVSPNTFVVEPGYYSLGNSYMQIHLKKTQILTSPQDTNYTTLHLSIPLRDVWKAINDVYGSNVVKRQIKQELKVDYKKKTFK